MKKIETLDDAFIRIAELERENEALREELAYYKNRKMSGRRKHNAKWQRAMRMGWPWWILLKEIM